MKNAIKYYLLAKKDIRLTSQRPKCIIFMAADYGNYGDLAITETQVSYLKTIFPNYDIITYNLKDSIYYLRAIVRAINKKDIITIIGGGNFGDLYLPFEKTRRYIVKKLRNFNIVSFPQTISYSNEHELRRSLCVYKKSKLVVVVREQKSYSMYKKYFPDMILIPDIVLYNRVKCDINSQTGKIAFIFRDDKEKLVQSKLKNELYKLAEQYGEIDSFDTTFSASEEFDNHEILNDFLSKVSTYNYIFTDRLHAMIFGYLLNIPTIVIDNSNGKISSTYNTWLKDSKRILYLGDSYNQFTKDSLIKFISAAPESEDNSSLEYYFNNLAEILHQKMV